MGSTHLGSCLLVAEVWKTYTLPLGFRYKVTATAMNKSFDVIIIGAGIVGAAIAIQAQQSGLQVALLDREEPGSGASFGNAGTFADYGCIPVNSPSLPFRVSGMLWSAESPFSVRWSYLPKMLPWLWQFLLNCRPQQVRAISETLAGLLSAAEDATTALLKMAAAEDLVVQQGCLYVCSTERGKKDNRASLQRRKALGAVARLVSGPEIHELEPALAPIYLEGILFERARHTVDPQALVTRLSEQFIARGGTLIRDQATAIEMSTEHSIAVQCEQQTVVCKQLVIAAGAWSKQFLGSLTESVPLETERGYHVSFAGGQSLLQRPVGWAEMGFYMTPMQAGLRAAGTVELGGLHLPANNKRLTYIERNVRQLLPGLGPRSSEWLGFRPSLPDALPVIGRSARNQNIIFAFGHQHLGLTLAGITGQIVAQLLTNTPSSMDISAFSPDRFH